MHRKKLMFLVIGLAILVSLSVIAAFYMSLQNIIRVACVGDSITEGTYYPMDLMILLGTNYSVGNFGVGGSAVSLDSGKPYMNENAFQEAKAFHPNIVIIMLGANDASPLNSPSNDSFVEDYVQLIGAFQMLSSKPKMYIVKPPPVFSDETGLNPEFFLKNIIPNIEKVAEQTNLPIIDVYSALANSSNFFPDGVHPNAEGAQLIANTIYKAITHHPI
jgi:lysophospholipase L1-like esterase